MSDFERTTDSWLSRHYGGKPKRIAFVDETFSNRPVAVRHPFYAVAAFIINSTDVDDIRSDFADIAGHRRWHTTERFQEADPEPIRKFSRYIADGPGSTVVVVEVNLDSVAVPNVEKARRDCMRGMTRILAERYSVNSVLYERRRPFEQKIDDETMKPLRVMYPSLVIRDVGADAEPLLWGPDVLAWTFQRRLIEHEDWFDPFVGVTHVYRPAGGAVAGFGKLSVK